MRIFKSCRRALGKVAFCSRAFLQDCAGNSSTYLYETRTLSKVVSSRQLEWLHLMIEAKSTVIPDKNTLLRLAYHGFIKIEVTEEGKAFFEKEGRARILVKYLEKL